MTSRVDRRRITMVVCPIGVTADGNPQAAAVAEGRDVSNGDDAGPTRQVPGLRYQRRGAKITRRATGVALLAALLMVAGSQMSCSRSKGGAMPSAAATYTPPGGQRWFQVRGCDDPRVMTIMRAWKEPVPPPTYYVFELVNDGRRLSLLHKQALRYHPWMYWCLGKGRFLVTLGEIPGIGLTDKCLVVHDLARGASVAWRRDDFVPADTPGLGEVGTMPWYSGSPYFDPQRLLFHVNDVYDCRDGQYPFIVVDLRSRSFQNAPVPSHRDPEVVRAGFGDYEWWFSSDTSNEPDGSPLPAYLLAGVVQKHDSPHVVGEDRYRIEQLTRIGLVEGEPGSIKTAGDRVVPGWQTCFKLDATTGDYVRCPLSEWVDRGK